MLLLLLIYEILIDLLFFHIFRFLLRSVLMFFQIIILKIPNKAGKIITVALTVFMIFNAVMSLLSVWRWSERVHNVPATTIADEFFDKRFPDSRMERIFANMEFDSED